MSQTNAKHVSLPKTIGRGYGEFWRSRHRYRVLKGSRASKKSTTTSLWYIYHLMKHPDSNLLVVRKTFRTLKDSCFTQLKWAARQLGVSHLWHFTSSPLEATYIPTGQKIYFRGLDDPLKVTSITVEKGALCWIWIEEAYEIDKETDFDILDESIRGELPNGLWKQITITFNPWSDRHWLKSRFFDTENPEVLALTTNYLMNEFLDKADLAMFQDMKLRNPRRYNVAGLGNWGITEGLIFENWRVEDFDIDMKIREIGRTAYGMDFGFRHDPTTLPELIVDLDNKKIYIFGELYKTGLLAKDILNEINKRNLTNAKIIADSEDPRTIAELNRLGVVRMQAAVKGKDSVRHGINFLQSFEIIVHPECTNTQEELSLYSYKKDKFGKWTNEPEDNNNHIIDAIRYALEPFHFKQYTEKQAKNAYAALKRLT